MSTDDLSRLLHGCEILSQRVIFEEGEVKILEVFVRGKRNEHPELKFLGPIKEEECGWSQGPETRVEIAIGLPPEVYLG